MRTLARILVIWTIGTAFGTMIFFTGIVAEAVFRTLSEDAAGTVLSVIFPPYYTLTSILSAIGFLASIGIYAGNRRWYAWTAPTLLGVASAILFVSWLWILPVMNAIRLRVGSFAHSSSPLVGRFFMYHGISMLLDIVALVLLFAGLTVFAATAWRAGKES